MAEIVLAAVSKSYPDGATEGQPIDLAFDTSKLAIFDADSGVNLTIPPLAAK